MDIQAIRNDFPILERRIHGHPLIYLDNAATTHKPRQVLETWHACYTQHNANIHRSPHTLGQEASDLYEQAHRGVARYIGAESWRQVVFVRNGTEAINLVAYSLMHGPSGRLRLSPGDEIVLTVMEHHSNWVPWQLARDECGVTLKVVDICADGTLDLQQLQAALSERTRLVCCTHVSNVLGTINPVREIGRLAHAAGALLLVDGAQSVPHLPVTVQELDCDFLAFSGHKMLAPMGIGVLYGRAELLEQMAPFLRGGDMIDQVNAQTATWNRLPWKFEAGTPDVAGAVALGGAIDHASGQRLVGAIDYLTGLGMEAVRSHELELTSHLLRGLQAVPGVRVFGPSSPEQRCGVVAFDVHSSGEFGDAHLIAELLNEEGIAVRAGGHCAYPLLSRLGVPGTLRASVYLYNTMAEIDRLLDVLQEIISHKLVALA
ncbi:MAG: SufS family cysteine desulfurase [Chloroflexi bacterium]|nr:SufS family cysteine desulfurase [Chloroflexota bacterium]